MDTVAGAKTFDDLTVPQSTISRYACRVVVSRHPPYTARIFAAGFDASKNIFLGVMFRQIARMPLTFAFSGKINQVEKRSQWNGWSDDEWNSPHASGRWTVRYQFEHDQMERSVSGWQCFRSGWRTIEIQLPVCCKYKRMSTAVDIVSLLIDFL